VAISQIERGDKVYIPAMLEGSSRLLAAAFRAHGYDADVTAPSDGRTLELGSRYTGGDECYPARVTVGDFFKLLEKPEVRHSGTVLFMPTADGPCRFGQYAPYLRRILDANGYQGVRVLAPNCADGYAGLGQIARPFLRTAWRAAVAGDILHKLLLMKRPYELEAGGTDRVYWAAIERICEALESAPVAAGSQMREMRRALGECRRRFRGIPVRSGARRPLIAIVGEIFCRLNTFSNHDVVRRLEEYGAEVWMSDFCEWIWYANTEELRLLKLGRRKLTARSLAAWVRCRLQRKDEETLIEPFGDDFAGRREPPIEEVIRAADRYLPASGAVGEMVVNAGRAACLARQGVDGILDISPFSCMNGIVAEAVYPRLSKDLGGIPIRNLYFDGAEADLELDLGIFVEMAGAFRARRDPS
jgi:predicted nucleotide-binding protein (sugar kinase/HSP70/actin superfamily)